MDTEYKRSYRMPTGEYTENVDVYLRSWEFLTEEICRMMNLKVKAFDPSVAFVSESDDSERVVLPVWFLTRFNNLVAE